MVQAAELLQGIKPAFPDARGAEVSKVNLAAEEDPLLGQLGVRAADVAQQPPVLVQVADAEAQAVAARRPGQSELSAQRGDRFRAALDERPAEEAAVVLQLRGAEALMNAA